MRRLSVFASVSATALLLVGCVAPSEPPPRPAPPVPVPAPAPSPTPAPPASADWRDWPLTPGNWRYSPAPRGSSATYGPAGPGFVFRIACDAASRRITLSDARPATAPAFTIRTTSLARTLPAAAFAHADAWPPQTRDAQLAANDSLLDAIGYSRGRFLVETPGAPPLVIPAWAEIQRVVEDCRG